MIRSLEHCTTPVVTATACRQRKDASAQVCCELQSRDAQGNFSQRRSDRHAADPCSCCTASRALSQKNAGQENGKAQSQ